MVSLSNHEGLARAAVRRFMVRLGKARSVLPVLTMKRFSAFSVRDSVLTMTTLCRVSFTAIG